MKPKVRQIIYAIGVVLFAGLSILSTFRIIEPDTAATVSAALTSVLGLFGVTGFGVAAAAVTRQINAGSFDKATPADQIVNGITAVLEQAAQAQAEVDRVKDAVSQAVQQVPVLGPLAQQAIDSLPR